ncbi:HDOD domain-containing protein [Clostridiales bacterium COT073_COT-073]|nr:HDOD domain-containing protein [Clostridiales bacterium COT073_COT-073]
MKKITMEEILQKVNHIPAFPATMVKLLRMMDDPEVKVGTIKEVIRTDEGLTVKLLRVANSAFYRGRREIKTIEDAVILLGLRTVKSMVFSVTVGPMMSKELGGYDLGKEALWRQSQLSAMTAQLIAKKSGFKEVDLAYTAGLLKDVGKVILDEYVKNNLDEVMALVEERGMAFSEAETELFGISHAEVGAQVAERWNLPAEIVEVIRHHHDPAQAEINPKLAMICHLADNLIMMMGINLGADGMAYAFNAEALETLGLTETDVTEIMSEIAEFVDMDDIYF